MAQVCQKFMATLYALNFTYGKRVAHPTTPWSSQYSQKWTHNHLHSLCCTQMQENQQRSIHKTLVASSYMQAPKLLVCFGSDNR